MAGRGSSVIHVRAARLSALLLLVSAAVWAAINLPGHTASMAATEYRWPVPDWMPPPPVPLDNPMSSAKVELGRRLFFDVRLAGLNYISCATCHRPELGFSDGRTVAIGLTGQRHPRNSQALANVAYLPTLTWTDPDVTSLEQQAELPLFGEHPVEMLAAGREPAIVARFEVDLRYAQLFAAAFPETGGRIDFVAIRKALAAFERTLLSFDSPYDRWRYGGEANAIGAAAKRGEGLFFSERLACGRCHPAPLFTDAAGPNGYHNTGLYNLDGAGAVPAGNQGLVEHTGKLMDMGKFRTPSLRNVAVTAPYMHDGSIATLEAVVQHYDRGGIANPWLTTRVRKLDLTSAEVQALVRFMEALSGEGYADTAPAAFPQ